MSSTMTKILVPLDGTEHAERVATLVQRVTERRPLEVMLLRVIPRQERSFDPSMPDPERTACHYLERVRRELARVEGTEVRYDLVCHDEPARAILTFAFDYSPALIAMATHGRTGLGRLLHGSVTEDVLRGSCFPVLTATHATLAEDRRAPSGPRRILVPLDGSKPAARCILPLVIDIASRGAEVVLLHVIPLAGLDYPVGPVFTAAEAEAIMGPYRAALEACGLPVKVATATGSPSSAILSFTESEGVGLIAMTTHGRSGVSRLVLGSIAEEVLRRAPCPVLVRRVSDVPVSLDLSRISA